MTYVAAMVQANHLLAMAQNEFRSGDYPGAIAKIDAAIAQIEKYPRAHAFCERARGIKNMIERKAAPSAGDEQLRQAILSGQVSPAQAVAHHAAGEYKPGDAHGNHDGHGDKGGRGGRGR